MRKYNQQSHPQLYHISSESHDGELFLPRIPNDAIEYEEEDSVYPRICVSTSIIGCVRAIDPGDWISERIDYYVHVPEDLDSIYESGSIFAPTKKEIPDVEFTREKWITTPTKFRCIGIINAHHPFKRKGYFNWKLRNFN